MPQFKSEKAAAKKTEKSSCVLELDFWSTRGGTGKAHIHTQSNKVYSPEQPSQENSHRVSDTRFILFQNHAGELVVTASSRVRPQTTDRHTCFTETGNKQEHYLTRYIMGTHWRCPHSNLFEDYLWQSRTKVQPDFEYLLGFWLVGFFFTINS